MCVCSAVPRHPGHNNVWEFDIELGNIAEDARDDPGKHRLHCVIKEVNIHIFKKADTTFPCLKEEITGS